MKQSELEIPVNKLKPVNGRIFCVEVVPELKTTSGLVLPQSYQRSDAKGSRKIERRRYFVVDVANNIKNMEEVKFTDNNGKKRSPQRFDEVTPLYVEDVEEYHWPKAYDYATGKEYTVFHYTELQGIQSTELLILEEDKPVKH